MRKIILLILLIAFSAGSVKSQVLIALVFGDKLNTPNIEFGLNVGGNFSTLANHPDAKYKTGLNLGLYFNFKLGDHLYLHPELQFINQMGTRGTDNRDLPGNDWDDETLETLRDINYLTLVFLPRYKLTNQLYFEAGIRGSFLLSADDIWMVKPEERSELYYKDFIRNDLNSFDVGVDAGLGFKFGKGEGVNLSLRYSYGFLNILRDSGEPAEYNRAFHVQVGIPIGVGKENIKEKLD